MRSASRSAIRVFVAVSGFCRTFGSRSSVVSGFSRTILIALALFLVIFFSGTKAVWGSPQARLSNSLRAHIDAKDAKDAKSKESVDVIVHGTADEIDALAARQGLSIERRLQSGAVLRANAAQIEALSNDGAVDHLSPDVRVSSFMSVTNPAIGADQVWEGVVGLPGFDGTGIGIALIDSGVWTQHRALASRVVFAKSFTGEGKGDKFGHGTHIAGIIAGNSDNPSDGFRGVAPGAHLISLDVIEADGTGLVSSVIEALDWVVANRKKFNIRVANVALGHPVDQSYRDDPMCEAVERAVNAGVVVVVAAGNRGKNDKGEPVYGSIDSPGNDPYVITVGALNTKGTIFRSDDELTTYSGKGPTWIDGLIKPDLAAPGNKIVSAEAAGSSLITENPSLHASGSGADAYMTLSGTSMATGVVSGAAGLVLQVNPKLKPAQVKIALQYSASFMPETGLVGAGAGSLNVAAAVQVAKNGPEFPAISTVIGGEEVGSSGLVVISSQRLAETDHIIWSDHIIIIWSDHIIWGEMSGLD